MKFFKKKKPALLVAAIFSAVFLSAWGLSAHSDDTDFQSITTVKEAPIVETIVESPEPTIAVEEIPTDHVIVINSDDKTVNMGILEWVGDKYHLVTVKSQEYMDKWSKSPEPVEEGATPEGKSEPTSQEN